MTNHVRILSWLVIVVGIAPAHGQPVELTVTNGPLAGSVVRILSKTTNSTTHVAHRQLMVSQERTNWPVFVEVDGVKTNLSATLAAYGFSVLITNGETNRSVSLFAMVVESNIKPTLWWFCTRPAGHEMPRDFKVFTTKSGNTYACYVYSGFHLFRVREMKDETTAWREYWEWPRQNEDSSDAIKPLRMDVLFQTVGRDPWYDYNASYFTGVVDDVFETDGELRVALHARRSEPKHTFALRQGKWELISSTGEELSDTIIYQARRKALVEQFDAEVKAKSEGKDPYEGTTFDSAMRRRIERIEAELSAKASLTNENSGVQTNKQEILR